MPYASLGGSGALESQPVGIHVPVDLLSTPTTLGQGSWALSMQATPGGYYGLGFAYNAGQGQNDNFTWQVLLATGTWTAEYYFMKGSSSGIVTASLDGTTIFTQDHYAATTSGANYATHTGIVVGSSALHALKLQVATKNASSTSYFMIFQRINFVRTA